MPVVISPRTGDAGGRAVAAPPVDELLALKAVSLVQALEHNEDIRNRLERWSDELSAINEVMARVIAPHGMKSELECAIDRSEALESKIQEAVDDLTAVNVGLTAGIADGKHMTRKLLSSDTRGKKIRQLAFHDPLTGLPNRALFDDRLKQALAQAERHGRGAAVMFIDLDDFKAINDANGHDAGDGVLRQVAKRLRGAVRAEDTVSRRGGDEFLCLLMNGSDPLSIGRLARKMIHQVSAPMDVGKGPLNITPSIGIAIYPNHGMTALDLVMQADVAMYRAKRTRRGFAFATRTQVQ